MRLVFEDDERACDMSARFSGAGATSILFMAMATPMLPEADADSG